MTTVVTGAGSGIGRATAELLLDAGEAVVGVDVEPERLEWLDDRDRAVAVAGDVGTEEANADMVSEAIWHSGRVVRARRGRPRRPRHHRERRPVPTTRPWRIMSALEGKTAFVAGGTSGIGLAVAAAFAAAGARVTIAGRRPDGPEIARDAGCGFASLDVADETSVVAALDQADVRLGALVLNAGISHIGSLERTGPEVVDTNLLGVFWGLKHGPARMADGGSIILTSSISAVMGTPFEGLYGAAKAGVSALARSAAIDLGHRGIRVNAVQPGPTWTPMNPMPERLLEIMAPAGRKGRVEDLVGVYEFLASDASRYVTGQAITVDGGVTVGISQALMGVLAAEMAA